MNVKNIVFQEYVATQIMKSCLKETELYSEEYMNTLRESARIKARTYMDAYSMQSSDRINEDVLKAFLIRGIPYDEDLKGKLDKLTNIVKAMFTYSL